MSVQGGQRTAPPGYSAAHSGFLPVKAPGGHPEPGVPPGTHWLGSELSSKPWVGRGSHGFTREQDQAGPPFAGLV